MAATLRIALLGTNDGGRALLAKALQNSLPKLQIYSDCALMCLTRSAHGDQNAKTLDSLEFIEVIKRHRQDFDLTLLLCEPSARPGAVDLQLRQWLLQSALPFASIFGSGAAQAASAESAIQHQMAVRSGPMQSSALWHWNCRNCSDAACEHRLFRALLV